MTEQHTITMPCGCKINFGVDGITPLWAHVKSPCNQHFARINRCYVSPEDGEAGIVDISNEYTIAYLMWTDDNDVLVFSSREELNNHLP